ncbi:MAG: YqjF family protein [Pirellulaceae bacterium]
MIDRLTPTQRPAATPRGYQSWRDLLFLHWPVPLDILRARVPSSLELDLYQGVGYVGLVPFAMRGVRPAWWPRWCGQSFLETNVRTYVVHEGRPGVYFLSLEAASGPAVWAARRFWGLPYFWADMHMTRTGDEVSYGSQRRRGSARLAVRYRIGKPLGESAPDSREFFFLERYLLFVERRSRLYVGQVHHRPYPAQSAQVLEISDELIQAAGLGAVTGPPALVHYSPGVDVEVFALRRA